MFRILSITITLAAIISMSGCVLGPRCGGGHCNDCDGVGSGSHVGMGPGASFRQWRKSLTCGSGCGETYYDEWYSSPPDCEDPCPQFAGGACGGCGGGCAGGCGVGCLDGGCSPECGECRQGIQPMRTIASLAIGLYGKRFCGGCGYDVGDCCCGDVGGGCGGGCSGGCDGGCGGGEVYSGGAVMQGGGGCANGNCSINHSGGSQVAGRSGLQRSPAHQQVMARQQRMARVAQAPATAKTNTARQVIHPPEPNQANQKFYRQATRLPQGQSAFRR